MDSYVASLFQAIYEWLLLLVVSEEVGAGRFIFGNWSRLFKWGGIGKLYLTVIAVL